MEYWQTQVHVLGQALARSDAVAKGRGHELHLPAPCSTPSWPLAEAAWHRSVMASSAVAGW